MGLPTEDYRWSQPVHHSVCKVFWPSTDIFTFSSHIWLNSTGALPGHFSLPRQRSRVWNWSRLCVSVCLFNSQRSPGWTVWHMDVMTSCDVTPWQHLTFWGKNTDMEGMMREAVNAQAISFFIFLLDMSGEFSVLSHHTTCISCGEEYKRIWEPTKWQQLRNNHPRLEIVIRIILRGPLGVSRTILHHLRKHTDL